MRVFDHTQRGGEQEPGRESGGLRQQGRRAGHGRDVQEVLELGIEAAGTGQRVPLPQFEPMD